MIRTGCAKKCGGLGKKLTIDQDALIDTSKSLNEGALAIPFLANWELNSYKASKFFDNDKKLADFSPEEMELLLWGKGRKFKMQVGENTMNASYLGVLEKITQSYIKRDLKTLSERTQKAVGPYLR